MKRIPKMIDSGIDQQNLDVCNFKFARLALIDYYKYTCMQGPEIIKSSG